MAYFPQWDTNQQPGRPLRTLSRRQGGVRHSMPAGVPSSRPLPEISRAASTTTRQGPTARPMTGRPSGDRRPEPLPLAMAATIYRNVPENCGGTYSSDMSSPAARCFGAIDLTHSVGVYFSIGVKRCFFARISAKVLNLYGPPELTVDSIMAAKIRHEVAARLSEEALRSKWPEVNAHMRETAMFICAAAAEPNWEQSTLFAVVQGVQDWLGWKSKLKGAILRFGGILRPNTIVRESFVINRQVLGNASVKLLESPDEMTSIDDIGSGQFWEVVVVRSVPTSLAKSRLGSRASISTSTQAPWAGLTGIELKHNNTSTQSQKNYRGELASIL
nr:hypothetical protein CFP56_19402 [Quercus suber]